MAQDDHQSRRHQERREQTRTALLDAAERLWAERGVNGASLGQVAGAAGLTKGAVYSNFTGKTDLLLALLDRHTQVDDGLGHGVGVGDDDPPDRPNEDGHGLTGEEGRLRTMLLVEFWLYGMRDFAAGWRVADWYHARRAKLAGELTDTGGLSAAERATMAIAMDLGLAFQQLLDPERVPASVHTSGMGLVLGAALP